MTVFVTVMLIVKAFPLGGSSVIGSILKLFSSTLLFGPQCNLIMPDSSTTNLTGVESAELLAWKIFNSAMLWERI